MVLFIYSWEVTSFSTFYESWEKNTGNYDVVVYIFRKKERNRGAHLTTKTCPLLLHIF